MALPTLLLRARVRALTPKKNEINDTDRATLQDLVDNKIADIFEEVRHNPHMKIKDFDLKGLKALSKKLNPRKG